MTSTDTPIMTGQEIVTFIQRLERECPVVDKKTFTDWTADDFSYALDKFPDSIRKAIGDRIQANGLKEAAAISRAVLSSKRDYASIAFYLECVEAFLRINSYGKSQQHQQHVSSFQAVQFGVGESVDELELNELEGHELEQRHYALVTAAHLLKTLDITEDRYRVKHDYHVDVELVRVNLDRVMEHLDAIMVQDYNLVLTKDVASLVVCIATHTEIDPERMVRMVVERKNCSPEMIDSLVEGNVAPLDAGVL